MDDYRAWDSTIPGRWTATAREIPRFPSDGTLPRVRFRDSRVVDPSSAWDLAILERWNAAARGILQFLGGGTFQRVKFRDSRAVERYRA